MSSEFKRRYRPVQALLKNISRAYRLAQPYEPRFTDEQTDRSFRHCECGTRSEPCVHCRDRAHERHKHYRRALTPEEM